MTDTNESLAQKIEKLEPDEPTGDYRIGYRECRQYAAQLAREHDAKLTQAQQEARDEAVLRATLERENERLREKLAEANTQVIRHARQSSEREGRLRRALEVMINVFQPRTEPGPGAHVEHKAHELAREALQGGEVGQVEGERVYDRALSAEEVEELYVNSAGQGACAADEDRDEYGIRSQSNLDLASGLESFSPGYTLVHTDIVGLRESAKRIREQATPTPTPPAENTDQTFHRGEANALRHVAEWLGIPGRTYHAIKKEIGQLKAQPTEAALTDEQQQAISKALGSTIKPGKVIVLPVGCTTLTAEPERSEHKGVKVICEPENSPDMRWMVDVNKGPKSYTAWGCSVAHAVERAISFDKPTEAEIRRKVVADLEKRFEMVLRPDRTYAARVFMGELRKLADATPTSKQEPTDER